MSHLKMIEHQHTESNGRMGFNYLVTNQIAQSNWLLIQLSKPIKTPLIVNYVRIPNNVN